MVTQTTVTNYTAHVYMHTEQTGIFTTDRSFTTEVKFKFLAVPQEITLKIAKDLISFCALIHFSQINSTYLK